MRSNIRDLNNKIDNVDDLNWHDIVLLITITKDKYDKQINNLRKERDEKLESLNKLKNDLKDKKGR